MQCGKLKVIGNVVAAMAKTWAGWTEKRWRNTITWQTTSHQFTFATKASTCYRWRKTLIALGDWETFPKNLKEELQRFSFLHVMYTPGLIETEKRGGPPPIKWTES